MPQKKESFYETVYRITRKIPSGRVTTYGQIALLAGSPRASRAVGYALHNLHGEILEKTPWHRVINAQGKISCKGDVLRASLQKKLLEAEGIVFDENDKINLTLFAWK